MVRKNPIAQKIIWITCKQRNPIAPKIIWITCTQTNIDNRSKAQIWHYQMYHMVWIVKCLMLFFFFLSYFYKTFLVVFAIIIMFFLLKKLYNEFVVINCLVMLLFKKWEKFVMSKYYLNGSVDVG